MSEETQQPQMNTQSQEIPTQEIICPKTPEKQKQEHGQKPSPSHCKNNGLFLNFESPPDGGFDEEIC